MTRQIRYETYSTILRKPIDYFDNKKNSTGIITNVLGSDVRNLNGASAESYILIFQGFAGLSIGITLGIIYAWKVALVGSFVIVLNGFGTYYSYQIQFKRAPRSSEYLLNERLMLSETISNYSTVASLGYEDELVNKYYQNKVDNKSIFGNPHINPNRANLLGLL